MWNREGMETMAGQGEVREVVCVVHLVAVSAERRERRERECAGRDGTSKS